MSRLPRPRTVPPQAGPGLLLLVLVLGLAIASLLLPSPARAGADPFAGLSDELLLPQNPYLFTHSVTLWNGYRNEQLDPGAGPDELDLYELGVEACLRWDRISARGAIDHGWAGGDGESWDYLAGFGYDVHLTVTGVHFTPVAGYASSRLDRGARYAAEWSGPFLGATLEVPLAERWLVRAGYFYHWADFEADYPTALGPVTNLADASGHTGRIDLIHHVSERLDLSLGTELQSYSSEAGSFSRTAADRDSWSLRFGISYNF